MSLITNIETIVNTLYPTYEFILASKQNADDEIFNNDTGYYIILDDTITKDKELQQNANILTYNSFEMWCMQLRDEDDSDETVNTKCLEMELVGDRIMTNIFQLDSVLINNNESFKYKSDKIKNFFISILCGQKITFKVKENQIISYCKE